MKLITWQVWNWAQVGVRKLVVGGLLGTSRRKPASTASGTEYPMSPTSWDRALLMMEQDSCGDFDISLSLLMRAMGGFW